MTKPATTCLLCAHYTEQGECHAHPPTVVPFAIEPDLRNHGAFIVRCDARYPETASTDRCGEYAPAFRRASSQKPTP